MTPFEWVSVALTIVTLLIVPMVVALLRGMAKWTRVELRLEQIVTGFTKFADDNSEAHRQMVAQMRDDRNATNDRLTWLERNLWRQQAGGRQP